MIISTQKDIPYGKKKAALSLLSERLDKTMTVDIEIASSSMKPFLCEGDVVCVKKVDIGSLKKGDVIVLLKNDHLCVHRYICHSNEAEIKTKGDNIFYFDDMAEGEKQFFGKVIIIKQEGREINLESSYWRIVNYLMAHISAAQANMLIFLQESRRIVLKNRIFKPGEYIRDGLCSMFYFTQKVVVSIARVMFFQKHETIT